MQYNDLESYLQNLFSMKMNFNYTISDVENMIPWERDVHIDLINEKLRKEADGNN